MKIKELLATKKVNASGFAAIAELSKHSKGTEEVVLSSLAPSVLAEQGVIEYYALQLPRGMVFNTAEEIIEADLPVRKYRIDTDVNADGLEVVVISRHQGTVDLLKQQYPNAVVLDQISAEDIAGKHVVGTLPPHLITSAGAYTAVTIANFDYTKDGDLSGVELKERLTISDKPIKVKEIN
ncbi:hypothetical protein BH753_gp041 [Bacillus phage Shbh1]|uniref:Uncharacterized protein n=1 Tax=Bacillus phage Shbh1 TaxID=1796992 RepID=A0A142F166_9CAUD|nr:hypothetical protein BH753_gp041 [Bacillus phage Shbh1]AMQ66523.1 hypothetical protein [Bacillus phage Shbh1]